jgi:LacI family transcriptional regulator
MATSLKDVAHAAGVSPTTASRALAGYDDVAEDTRLRVIATAETLGYEPNLTARRLRKKRTDTLGFIVPTFGPRFSDPFFSEFIAGIGNEAAVHDYDLLVSTHAPDSEGEQRAYKRAVKGGWVDGLLVVRTRLDDKRIDILCENGFPFVAFGQTEGDFDFPFIDEDSVNGVRLLVEHFVDLGHKRIAFIKPPNGLMFGRHRLSGYLKAMEELGLEIKPEWIVHGDLTQHSGAEAVEPLLKLSPRPTAIIAGNDLMAIGAMNRIDQAGLTVGQDIAVGGFDDIPMSAFVNPPLTTIHQPIYDIGRETCSMLIDILNDRTLANGKKILSPELIVRKSSCEVRNDKKEVHHGQSL